MDCSVFLHLQFILVYSREPLCNLIQDCGLIKNIAGLFPLLPGTELPKNLGISQVIGVSCYAKEVTPGGPLNSFRLGAGLQRD